MIAPLLQCSMSTKEVAEYLGLSEITVKRWRAVEEGPKHFNIGGRIWYRRTVVEQWLTMQSE